MILEDYTFLKDEKSMFALKRMFEGKLSLAEIKFVKIKTIFIVAVSNIFRWIR